MSRTATILPQPGELLQSGGEADVYRVLGDGNVLLKIYKKEPNGPDIERVDELIARKTPVLLDHAAWPLRRVRITGRTALLIPFMQDAEQIHALYDPISRVRKFPGTDWIFAVRVAQRLAAACAAVHQAGIVLADISEKNVLVDLKGNPTLIDCDSFVFAGRGLKSASLTYSEGFLPPELPVKRLGEIPRQPNHDNYALAKLIFKLLFQGRDPLALVPGPTTTQVRVFTFDREGYGLPPASEDNLALEDIPREIAELFMRVFATELVKRQPDVTPPSRPTAAEWAAALARMVQQMRPCPNVDSHSQIGHDSPCPWCLRAAKRPEFDVFRDDRPSPVTMTEPEVAGPRPARIWHRIAIVLLVAGAAALVRESSLFGPAHKAVPGIAPTAPSQSSPAQQAPQPSKSMPRAAVPPSPALVVPPAPAPPSIISGEVTWIDIDRSRLVINGFGVRLHGIGPITLPGKRRFADLVTTKTRRVTCSSEPDGTYICKYFDPTHGDRDLSRIAIRAGAARALSNAPQEYLDDDRWAETRLGPKRGG